MKKMHLKCLLVLLLAVFLMPQKFDAANDKENYVTVYLKSSTYNNEFKKMLYKEDVPIKYNVEELGLFQIHLTSEKAQKILENKPYIDSYNESLQTDVTTYSSPRKSSSNLENTFSLGELWNLQWDMKKTTNNGESYNLARGSKNTTVAIIDSGVYADHPDLKSNIISSKNLVPKGGFRGEETEETGDINRNIDLTGHGTFLAGQIGANGLMKGVAPNIGIKSYRVFGGKSADSIWIINAIMEATEDDVDVINLSLGEYLVKGSVINENDKINKDQLAEIKAYKKALNFAHKRGTIVVASVGNDSLDMNSTLAQSKFWDEELKGDSLTFKGKLLDVPAQLPHVVTVSSVGPSDQLSLFSNYGKNFVDVAAYGGDTELFEKHSLEEYFSQKIYQKEFVFSTSASGGYSYNYGTSFSSPKVAATLALIIDKNNLHNSPNKVVHMLYKKGTIKGDKNKVGNGILNTYQALQP
ncbi:S8 family peptidase [Priestia endophytica]|uniref:S8 family peptidase n=1 Tax=Priestia endophytica TaxID=135735 RepID=UPI00124D0006|nr:S8 family serine peptidase [Priestia endophytica]KAB2489470.1 S8 family serine peptidase [Priestia endophytica]